MWPLFITGEYQKSLTFWMLRFSSSNRSQIYFLLFLELRDEQKVSQRNLYCFPNSRRLTLKEHNTVNSTTNLPTWRHLTNQLELAWFQILVLWNGSIKACLQAMPPFPHSQPTTGLALLHSWPFSHLTPFFSFFPHCEAWSQATRHRTEKLFSMGFEMLGLVKTTCLY